jgi:hypothetical protein
LSDHHLAAGAGSKGDPCLGVDGVVDLAERSFSQQEVGPAGVPAPEIIDMG